MLKLKKIAVTGGLAAGKSTVCQLLKELGAYHVSADKIVHQLLSPDTVVGQQVISLLGPEIVQGQELDRKKISAKVFSNPDLLRVLEELIHPAVFDEIERNYQEAKKEKKYPLFIVEIPLLYEVEKQDHFDAVISVYADPALCRKRFMQHPEHFSLAEFEKRSQRQFAPEQKAARAHFVIENNGTLEELEAKVKTLYIQLTSKESDF